MPEEIISTLKDAGYNVPQFLTNFPFSNTPANLPAMSEKQQLVTQYQSAFRNRYYLQREQMLTYH